MPRGTAPPRYSTRPLPAARYVPGRGPHPRRQSDAAPEPDPALLDPESWHESDGYLFAVDLHNAGYWWECHEALESLWRVAGRHSPTGRFLQALVWIAAAELKCAAGSEAGARRHAARALTRLAEFPDPTLGIDVAGLRRKLERRFGAAAVTGDPVRIELS